MTLKHRIQKKKKIELKIKLYQIIFGSDKTLNNSQCKA